MKTISNYVSNLLFTRITDVKKHKQTTLQAELVNSLSVPNGLHQIHPKNENLLLQKFQSQHQWYVNFFYQQFKTCAESIKNTE